MHKVLGNYQWDSLEFVDDGNKAFACMLFSGVNKGDYFGYRSKQMRVEWAGASLFNFEQEKITVLRVLGDVYGLFQQPAHNQSQ